MLPHREALVEEMVRSPDNTHCGVLCGVISSDHNSCNKYAERAFNVYCF